MADAAMFAGALEQQGGRRGRGMVVEGGGADGGSTAAGVFEAAGAVVPMCICGLWPGGCWGGPCCGACRPQDGH